MKPNHASNSSISQEYNNNNSFLFELIDFQIQFLIWTTGISVWEHR